MIAANFTIIDGIINIICLTLQFYFGKKYYDICCSKLHKSCESRYTKNVNSRLQKSVAAQNSLHILQLKTLDKQGTLGIDRIPTQKNLFEGHDYANQTISIDGGGDGDEKQASSLNDEDMRMSGNNAGTIASTAPQTFTMPSIPLEVNTEEIGTELFELANENMKSFSQGM